MNAIHTPRFRRRFARVGTAAAAIALAVLVLPGEVGGRPAAAAQLTHFGDCGALSEWFAAAAAANGTGPYDSMGSDPRLRSGGPFGGMETMPAQAGAPGVAVPEAGDASSGLPVDAQGPGATGTNIAEAGVDEPALIKVDGDLVVSVWENRLHVTDVSGAPRVLGSVRLPAGPASELLLVEDRALVLGSAWSSSPGLERGVDLGSARVEPVLPVSATAVLTVVDLSLPSRPAVVRTDEIDGTYLSAREHEGIIRVVLQTQPSLRLALPPGPPRFDDQPPASLLPQRTERDGSGAVVGTSPVLDCTEISHPAEPSGVGLLTVLTFDLTDPAAPITDRTGVATDGDIVYASTDRLVIATTRGGWLGAVASSDGSISDPASGQTSTELHGFDVTSRTATPYLGSGEVPGWILGRWALSAYDGFLRVASTREGRTPDAGTDSVVTVLAEEGDGYRQVGSAGGLGRGEQVRAVRWFGDTAVVVTFRQTDPLYTLDLSDPAAPRVLGELKIPGYSAYLHPLGDGLLLGVGQDATLEGQVLGTQVSTFDLRDLAEPDLLDTELDTQSWSDVESDSRQFTYLPGPRLAVLPIRGPENSALWSVRVGSDGTLSTAGRWAAGPLSWLAASVPLGDERMVVLSQEESGARLTLLGLGELTPLGAVQLR